MSFAPTQPARVQDPLSWRVSLWFLVGALAVALGQIVSAGQYAILAVLFGALPIVAMPLLHIRIAFWLLVVASLLQVPLGDIAGIPSISLTEVVVPLLSIGFALRAMVEGGFWSTFKPKETKVIHLLVLFFCLVLIGNYLRRPLLPSNIVSGSTEASEGLRVYYDYLLGFLVYAMVYYTLARRIVSFRRLLRGLLIVSVAICLLGLVTVLLGIPLDLGQLKYSVFRYGYGAVRVGFLELFSVIGLAMVIARAGPFKKAKWALIMGPFFVAALLFSGGRAAALGVLGAVVVYLTIKQPIRMMAVLLVAFLFFVFAPRDWFTNPQVQRFSAQEIGNSDRLFINQIALKEWAKSPIFGTGLGVSITVGGPSPELAAFYEEQLRIGGHALYATLLKNFGLVGFLPFMAILLLTLRRLIRARRIAWGKSEAPIATFVFVLLLASALASAGGGNGIGGNLSDPALYLTLGMGAAIIQLVANRRREDRALAAGAGPNAPVRPGGRPAAAARGRRPTPSR